MKGKGVWSTPGGVLVLLALGLYVAVAAVYLDGRGYFVRSPDRDFASVDYQPGDIVFDPTRIPEKTGKKAQPIDLVEAAEKTPAALAKGKSLFDDNCAACHGRDGKGDGPAAVALVPRPRDFASPKGWTNGYTLVDIFKTLTRGVEGSAMGSYDTLSVRDRFDLAHYVQSFGDFPYGNVTRADLEHLDDEFHLSEAGEQPSHAPVSRVMANMVADYRARSLPAFQTGGFTRAEMRLYRRAVTDPARAAHTLALVSGWRTNPEAFAVAVAGGAPGNGFSAAAGTFSDSEWKELQSILARSEPGS
jgi:mono/diheme cytochrome c family protein